MAGHAAEGGHHTEGSTHSDTKGSSFLREAATYVFMPWKISDDMFAMWKPKEVAKPLSEVGTQASGVAHGAITSALGSVIEAAGEGATGGHAKADVHHKKAA